MNSEMPNADVTIEEIVKRLNALETMLPKDKGGDSSQSQSLLAETAFLKSDFQTLASDCEKLTSGFENVKSQNHRLKRENKLLRLEITGMRSELKDLLNFTRLPIGEKEDGMKDADKDSDENDMECVGQFSTCIDVDAMDDKSQSPGEKGSEPPTEQSRVWSLAVAILALMKQDSKKMQQQLKAMTKANCQLACALLNTEVDGWTPAHACALRGSKKLMKAVIRTGVSVNSIMGQPEGLPGGCTLLHVAANRKDKKILNYLLQKGASVNPVDSNNHTPLDYAMSVGNKEAVRLLMMWGAITLNTASSSSSNNSSNNGFVPPDTISSHSNGSRSEKFHRGRSPIKKVAGKFKFGHQNAVQPGNTSPQQHHRSHRFWRTDKSHLHSDKEEDCQTTRLSPLDGLSARASSASPAVQRHIRKNGDEVIHQDGRVQIYTTDSDGGVRKNSDNDVEVRRNPFKSVASRLRPSSLLLSPRLTRKLTPCLLHRKPSPDIDFERRQDNADGSASRLPANQHDTSVPQSKSSLRLRHHQHLSPRDLEHHGKQNSAHCDSLSNRLIPQERPRMFSSTPCLLQTDVGTPPHSTSNFHFDNYDNATHIIPFATGDRRGSTQRRGSVVTGNRRCSSSENILESLSDVANRGMRYGAHLTPSPIVTLTASAASCFVGTLETSAVSTSSVDATATGGTKAHLLCSSQDSPSPNQTADATPHETPV